MPSKPTPTQEGLGAASAGLNLVSGVFGYLASEEAASVYRSRADMIRAEAQANAQRYSEAAASHGAQMEVMFLASGVTLAGSPLAALDKQKLLAQQNVDSILMSGETQALDEELHGKDAESRGRAALVGGFAAASKDLSKFERFGGAGKTGFTPQIPGAVDEPLEAPRG
jgi:hypothetical protein